MKRVLFILATVLLCINVQAQIVSSSSSRVVRIVEEKPKKPKKTIVPFETKHYVKGGINANNMLETQGYDYLLSVGSAPGFHLMYGMEKPFSKNAQWSCAYWGFETGVSRWSFSTDSGLEYGNLFNDYENSYHETWPSFENIYRLGLQLAPKIGLKIGSRGKKFSMGIEAGVYVNYNLRSSYRFDTWEYDDKELTNEFKEKCDLLMDAFFNEWNNLEAGVFVGVGCWIKKVHLGLKYSMAETPSFSNNECVRLIEGYDLPAGPFAHQNVYTSIGFSF